MLCGSCGESFFMLGSSSGKCFSLLGIGCGKGIGLVVGSGLQCLLFLEGGSGQGFFMLGSGSGQGLFLVGGMSKGHRLFMLGNSGSNGTVLSGGQIGELLLCLFGCCGSLFLHGLELGFKGGRSLGNLLLNLHGHIGIGVFIAHTKGGDGLFLLGKCHSGSSLGLFLLSRYGCDGFFLLSHDGGNSLFLLGSDRSNGLFLLSDGGCDSLFLLGGDGGDLLFFLRDRLRQLCSFVNTLLQLTGHIAQIDAEDEGDNRTDRKSNCNNFCIVCLPTYGSLLLISHMIVLSCCIIHAWIGNYTTKRGAIQQLFLILVK